MRDYGLTIDDTAGSTIGDQAVIIGRTLASYGRDAEVFFDRFALQVANRASPLVRHPATLMAELWNRAEEECGDREFRRRAVSQIQPDFYHLLTPALMQASSLEHSMQRLCRYRRVVSDAADVQFSHEGDTICLEFGESRERKSPAALDALRAYVCRIAFSYGEPGRVLKKISFTSPLCDIDDQLWGDLPCDVEGEADTNRIWFDRDVARQAQKSPEQANGQQQYLASYVHILESREDHRLQLQQLLQNAMEEGSPTLEQLAKQLNTSVRTLQRRLQNSSTSFRHELDATRCLTANALLADCSTSLSDIALILGCTDASHLCHKVRAWTGLSPRKYRQTLKEVRPRFAFTPSSA